MKKIILLLSFFSMFILMSNSGCDETKTSDEIQSSEQEKLAKQAYDQAGLPNVDNFTQKKQAKMIIEKCDQAGLIRYAYTKCEMTGKFRFISKCIGYGLPYATQYTNPMKVYDSYSQGGFDIRPQADPNGLFMPGSASATWLLFVDSETGDIEPAYFEDNMNVLPKPLRDDLVEGPNVVNTKTKINNDNNL